MYRYVTQSSSDTSVDMKQIFNKSRAAFTLLRTSASSSAAAMHSRPETPGIYSRARRSPHSPRTKYPIALVTLTHLLRPALPEMPWELTHTYPRELYPQHGAISV